VDNDGRFDFGDLDAPDQAHELEPMSLQEIANEFAAAATEMTPEQRACIRQAMAWQLLREVEWTPGDLEFLAEAGIRP
jgi:hypothetical protein